MSARIHFETDGANLIIETFGEGNDYAKVVIECRTPQRAYDLGKNWAEDIDDQGLDQKVFVCGVDVDDLE